MRREAKPFPRVPNFSSCSDQEQVSVEWPSRVYEGMEVGRRATESTQHVSKRLRKEVVDVHPEEIWRRVSPRRKELNNG
jgi:stress response protein YsnF